MRNDVSIVTTVMSVDPDCPPETIAMIGASIAVTISKIPFNRPISGVSVGMVDGQFVINPTAEQQKKSRMAVTVASTDKKVAMIEAGADQVTDEEMFDAIMFGHKANQQVIEFIKKIREEVGVPKMEFPSNDPSHEMYEDVEAIAIDKVRLALDTDDKRVRDEALLPIYAEVHEKLDEKYPEEIEKLDDCLYKLQKFVVRRWLLDERQACRRPRNRRNASSRRRSRSASPRSRYRPFHQRPDSGSDHRHPRSDQRRSDSRRS